jgi:hypothetical protein
MQRAGRVRQDVDAPLASVRPPFKGVRQDEVRRVCSQTLFPVDVEGDRQFYLSARHGKVVEKRHLMALLDGSLQQQLGGQAAKHSSQDRGQQQPVRAGAG